MPCTTEPVQCFIMKLLSVLGSDHSTTVMMAMGTLQLCTVVFVLLLSHIVTVSLCNKHCCNNGCRGDSDGSRRCDLVVCKQNWQQYQRKAR